MNNHYDPNQPRNAEGEWTDAGTAIREAASDLKFKEAKTVKEAEEWATGKIAESVDYTDMDLETANRLNSRIFELNKELGYKFSSIKTIDGAKDFAMGTDSKNNSLSINSNYDVNKIQTFYDMSEQVGKAKGKYYSTVNYFARNETFERSIDHEYGHLIRNSYNSQDLGKVNELYMNRNRKNDVSIYAGSSSSEFHSENFVMYINNKKDLLEPGVVDFFNKKLKKK